MSAPDGDCVTPCSALVHGFAGVAMAAVAMAAVVISPQTTSAAAMATNERRWLGSWPDRDVVVARAGVDRVVEPVLLTAAGAEVAERDTMGRVAEADVGPGR